MPKTWAGHCWMMAVRLKFKRQALPELGRTTPEIAQYLVMGRIDRTAGIRLRNCLTERQGSVRHVVGE
ncbi:hypothetical protein [Primorskyibacter sp. S87]|uniref:hypothetical protein n=1 Tax=Primorskyibacter sp. S87 TaxID=3415126 RepID=UPI003C7CA7A0